MHHPHAAEAFLDALGARFRSACGGSLAAPLPAALAPRFSSPVSYTPPHLAEKFLASRSALAGERCLHTGPGVLGQPEGVEVCVRLGLHTGQVVVRAIGDTLRMD